MPERMSLRLNPVINKYNDYQGVATTPSTVNYGILNDIVSEKIQAKHNTIGQQSAIKQSLGQIRQQLHQDEETLSWFDNKSKEIENKIDGALLEGNYNTALNIATQEAGNLASDAELLSRIKANQDYQAKVDETHKRSVAGKISADTERWWLANNQFKYEDVTDDNGNIIGGTSYSTLQTPVDDINIAEFTQQAFKMITPRVTDTKTTNADGTGSGYQRQWVTRQQIVDNLNNILDETPGARTAMNQRYQVEQYNYQQLLADPNADPTTVDKQRKKMEKNGSPVTFEEFCVRSIEDSAISQNLAYDHRATITDNQLTGKGTGKDNNNPDPDSDPNETTTVSVTGPKHEMKNKVDNAQTNANNSGKKAGNRMK